MWSQLFQDSKNSKSLNYIIEYITKYNKIALLYIIAQL